MCEDTKIVRLIVEREREREREREAERVLIVFKWLASLVPKIITVYYIKIQ